MTQEIEKAVRSGRMSRKQADAEYEQIKEGQKQKEKISRELHREMEEGMKELQLAVSEGKMREGKPAGKEMRCVAT